MNNFRKSYFKVGAVVAALAISCGGATASGDSDSGGGGNSGGMYSITIAESAKSNITTDKENAAENELVTLHVTENDADGWLDSGSLQINDGVNEYEPNKDDGETDTYTFYMPASAVTVKGTFAHDASRDANLNSLSPSNGSLVPAFNENTTSYSLAVPFTVSQITFSAVPNHQSASVNNPGTVDLNSVGTIPAIPITVTAQNGSTTKTYTVTVSRLPDASLASVTLTATDFPLGIDVIPDADMSPGIPYNNAAPPITVRLAATNSANATMRIGDTSYDTVSGYTASVVKGDPMVLQVVVSATQESLSATETYSLTLFRSADSTSPSSFMAEGGISEFKHNDDDTWDEVHTFKTSGTLTFTTRPSTARVLVVAGGGGGGAANYPSGGGGAGGMVENDSFSITGNTYTVLVGGGGAGGIGKGNANRGATGENSTFGTAITAYGGGGGGYRTSGGVSVNFAGVSGGSSGGSGGTNAPEGQQSVAIRSGVGGTSYGNVGGFGTVGGDYAGGGGGAGGPGDFLLVVTETVGTGGGAGRSNNITGASVTYSKGGDVAYSSNTTDNPAATANSGNGGSGAWNGNGGDGGSGIVVVRFPVPRIE
jgi:hypothetical protein